MFQRYAASALCCVFLGDLNRDDAIVVQATEEPTAEFARCRWFTWGWTLQELIVPTTVEFYDSSWGFRSPKSDLSGAIAAVTRIGAAVLCNSSALPGIPVARRMSWAANRQS